MSEVLFTSKATAKGGREGHVKSEDGIIDLSLVDPAKGSEPGSNPEQLFASGYAACYDGALNLIAAKQKEEIESATTAEVSLLKDSEDGGFKIAAVLHVEVEGVDQATAEALAKQAHDFCPYSKATRHNIDVQLNVKIK